jgi:hypothetical protein
MRRALYLIGLLVVGCAAVPDRPGNWLTRDGALADPLDYADCLSKARSTDQVASSGGALYALPQTDYTLLGVCMEAHGYQIRGRPKTVSRGGGR